MFCEHSCWLLLLYILERELNMYGHIFIPNRLCNFSYYLYSVSRSPFNFLQILFHIFSFIKFVVCVELFLPILYARVKKKKKNKKKV